MIVESQGIFIATPIRADGVFVTRGQGEFTRKDRGRGAMNALTTSGDSITQGDVQGFRSFPCRDESFVELAKPFEFMPLFLIDADVFKRLHQRLNEFLNSLCFLLANGLYGLLT